MTVHSQPWYEVAYEIPMISIDLVLRVLARAESQTPGVAETQEMAAMFLSILRPYVTSTDFKHSHRTQLQLELRKLFFWHSPS